MPGAFSSPAHPSQTPCAATILCDTLISVKKTPQDPRFSDRDASRHTHARPLLLSLEGWRGLASALGGGWGTRVDDSVSTQPLCEQHRGRCAGGGLPGPLIKTVISLAPGEAASVLAGRV